MLYLLVKFCAGFWPDRVSVGITIIIKAFVHTQVPVAADYDVVIIEIVQYWENVILEEIRIVPLRGSIDSYYEEPFCFDLYKSPDNPSILVFAISMKGDGKTFTE